MVTLSNMIGIVGVILQGVSVLLTGVSAFYIWRQLKVLAHTGQVQISENLSSQSIEILRHLRGPPALYTYFYENQPLGAANEDRSYILTPAEIVANFLEHIILQAETLPPGSREAWMLYVRDHYKSSQVVRDFIADHKDWYANAFLDYVSAFL